METRKMVSMNLFAGQQWRDRHREETYGHGRVSFSIFISSGYMPRSGNAGSYGGFIARFFKESLYRLP